MMMTRETAMVKTSISAANRAIARQNIPLELVRGDGYHYFIYDVPHRGIFETVSIYVPYTNTYKASEWAEQAYYVWQNMKKNLV